MAGTAWPRKAEAMPPVPEFLALTKHERVKSFQMQTAPPAACDSKRIESSKTGIRCAASRCACLNLICCRIVSICDYEIRAIGEQCAPVTTKNAEINEIPPGSAPCCGPIERLELRCRTRRTGANGTTR